MDFWIDGQECGHVAGSVIDGLICMQAQHGAIEHVAEDCGGGAQDSDRVAMNFSHGSLGS